MLRIKPGFGVLGSEPRQEPYQVSYPALQGVHLLRSFKL